MFFNNLPVKPARIEDARAWAKSILNVPKIREDGREEYTKHLKNYEKHLMVELLRAYPNHQQTDGYEYLQKFTAELTEKANKDAVAYEAALGLGADYLERRERMPHELEQFVVQHLRGAIKKPRQRGVHLMTQRPRNLLIWEAVEGLTLLGLKRTRNDASESGYSACDMVSEILINDIKIPLTFAAVYEAWSGIHRSLRR